MLKAGCGESSNVAAVEVIPDQCERLAAGEAGRIRQRSREATTGMLPHTCERYSAWWTPYQFAVTAAGESRRTNERNHAQDRGWTEFVGMVNGGNYIRDNAS